MEPYENFKPRCSIEEANRIAGQSSIEIMAISRECYINSYQKHSQKLRSDTKWNQNFALSSVYMLGFLSGCRAIRERKREEK